MEKPVVCKIMSDGYGSIPINSNFRGINIHLPAILMFTRVQGFDPSPDLLLGGYYATWRQGTIPSFRLGFRFSTGKSGWFHQLLCLSSDQHIDWLIIANIEPGSWGSLYYNYDPWCEPLEKTNINSWQRVLKTILQVGHLFWVDLKTVAVVS